MEWGGVKVHSSRKSLSAMVLAGLILVDMAGCANKPVVPPPPVVQPLQVVPPPLIVPPVPPLPTVWRALPPAQRGGVRDLVGLTILPAASPSFLSLVPAGRLRGLAAHLDRIRRLDDDATRLVADAALVAIGKKLGDEQLCRQAEGRLKSNPALAKVPVIILSSLASPEDKRRGLDAGADATLVKGELGVEVLAQTIDRLT